MGLRSVFISRLPQKGDLKKPGAGGATRHHFFRGAAITPPIPSFCVVFRKGEMRSPFSQTDLSLIWGQMITWGPWGEWI